MEDFFEPFLIIQSFMCNQMNIEFSVAEPNNAAC